MALIERMSILGIRSFSCESQQKIEFFTPVTLILGPNGTGKTTIIECLKYCTTGELPPGSKTGCSFIHDPRIVREVEVKAKVTLQIRDVTGCQMVVSRALVATQRDKAKHGTMKTLDGSIKRQSADGRITSMSSKCAEIDREMVTSLGVSKAVLENVIFCHQEDSNWPLQEAKSVKQRFDDLFASSRYVKALDVIRKCKQDKDANVRIYKTELKHLTKNREEANQLQSERELLLSSVSRQQDRLASVTKKLDPIAERLTVYRKKYTELIQLQAQVKSCESEKKQLEEIVSDLLRKIQNEFIGTTEELKTAIDDADLVYANKENCIVDLEHQLENAQSRLRTCEADQTKLLVEKAQLQMEVKTQREAVAKRDGLLQSFVRQFNFRPDCPQFLSPECALTKSDVQLVVSDLKEAVKRSEDQLAEVKRTADSEERAAQSELDSAREKLTRLEQKVEATEKLLRDGDAETVELKLRLEKGRSGAEQLESLRVELLQAEKLVADLSDSDDLCRLRSRSEELARQQQDVDTDLHSLDEKIDLFQQTAIQRREWEHLTSEKSTKMESARKIRSRHLDVLEQVLASLPVHPTLTEDTIQKELTGRRQGHATRVGPQPYRSQLRQAFLSRLSQLEQETKETRRRLENLQHERSGLETKTKYLRSQLQDKQNHSRRLEDNILAIAGTLEIEDSLTRLQQKRKVLDEECANDQGGLYLWQKFRDRLIHVDSDCPVCHRQLDSATERQELLTELDQRIRSMPDDFARKKQELAKLVEQHEALLQLRPTALELTRLKEDVLPSLERELTREVERLHKTCTVCEEETARLEAFQADESLAKSIQGDLAVLERVESEVLEVCEKLQHLGSVKDKIAGEREEACSLDDLQEQRKQLRAKITSLSSEAKDCHQRIDALDQNSRLAIGEVHRLKAAILEAEQEQQASLRLTLDLDRLTQRCQQLRSELQMYRSDQLPGLLRERNQAAERRRHASDQRETRVQQAGDECNRVRDALRQVNTACQAVSSSTAPADRLRTIEERLRLTDSDNAALQCEVKETSVRLEDARRVLHEHKLRQRELADCLRLGHLRAQLADLVGRVGRLSETLADCQAVAGEDQDLLKDTRRLTAEEERLQSEKQVVTNQLSQLTAKLEYLDRDLRDKYGNADSEYLDMMYQLKTTELACSDLEMYYKALDRAILAYHATKMTELNKVIKELWKATYSGNDIDYIEICSEEESPTSSASANAAGGNASRSRRTYNYRVVMVKSVGGGTSTSSAGGVRAGKQGHRHLSANCTEARLDMRGRCSAGQKVLASLIIRLALAEAFCLHCGVLALDEPTTNLDRENIENLAYALVEIIKNRRQQKNFQLLIITHDEDFVELLGRSDYVEQFYLLSRDSDGLSEIRKVPIGEHFH